MKFLESNTVELKEIVNNDFKKEIVAFANTSGGEIFVGVDNKGNVIGIDNAEKEMERISSMIRDGIKPDLIHFTTVETIEVENKNIIRVNVSRGGKIPYHLTDKGMKPSGVYVRHGVASVPASEEMIREMIKQNDGTTYDKARSLNQELTFDFAESFFKKYGVPFAYENKRTLGLIDSDGFYTNAALLLSDQCEHSIKCAIFKGTGKSTFRARKEFYGSILQQLEDAYRYIDLSNNNPAIIEGLQRIEHLDYPKSAVREALLNAIVHRDYNYSGSIIVNIFDDRIEFVSLGGLVKGISIDDIMHGVSQSRNMMIANIFYRLELIESYGTGIQRIIESYKREFIQFLQSAGVLKFGDFTAKSGRKIPYFINAGMIKTGDEIAKLGEFYAKAYFEKVGNKKAVLYGPAYKGISIAVSAAVALSKNGLDVPFFFNRKEVKDHGEGGVFVGYVPQVGEEVVIVEDVITAGTAIRESMAILSGLEGVKVAATFVMVDRKEKGKGEKGAMREIEEEFGFPVYSVVDVYDIIEYLEEDPANEENVTRIKNYLAVNGAK